MSIGKVVLRAMEPEDLDFLYAMENDRGVWSVGNTSVPYSRYVLHDYIANATNDIYADNQVRLVVENRQKETVGIVDIVDFCPQHQRAEVSLVVRADLRRRGYGAAIIAEVLDYAKRILHLHQLYAIVSEDNEASIGMFLKQGFESRNRLKDWLFDGTCFKDAIVMQKIL